MPDDAFRGAQLFLAPAWSVVSDRLLFARGLKLNGCLEWHLPLAHVVAAMPGGAQVGPPASSQVV